jgi:type IV pilus assembly protein PilO
MAAAAQKGSFESLPIAAKVLLLVMLIGVMSAIYYFALHMSLADDLEAAKNQYDKLQGDLKKAEKRKQEYLRLTQVLANREGIDRRNRRVLPAQAEIPAFLQDLTRLAELSGLNIRTVQPRPEETAEHFIKVPVQLKLTGHYHQLMKFFYNISQLERVVSLEDITLQNPRTKGEEVLLDVDVRAITYRRPEKQGGDKKGGQG